MADELVEPQEPDYNDVSRAISLANTPPEEAAKNIDRSQLMNVQPDQYVGLKDQLDPKAEVMERPSTAEPTVAELTKTSTQHASLVKDDIENLNYIERQMKFISNQVFDIPSNDEEIAKLRIKEMDGDEELTPEEQELLLMLNQEKQDLTGQTYGIDGFWEQLPGQVGSVVGDMFRSVGDNKEIVASMTVAGAGSGALAGVGIPLPFTTAIGAKAGAIAGFSAGVGVAGMVRGYQMIRGQMYNDLSFMTDDNGKPLNLDKSEKKWISHGVALIGGAASFYVGNKLAKNNPFLKDLGSNKAGKVLLNNPGLRKAISNLGYVSSSVLDGAGGEAIEELAAIIGEEIGKSDGSEGSVINAINNITSEESLKRLGHSAVIGGLASGTISGGSNAAYGAVQVAKNKAGLGLGNKVKPIKKAAGISDIPPRNVNGPIGKSTKVLNAQDAFVNISKVSQATKLKQLSPGEMADFKRKAFVKAGYGEKVWISPEDVQAFAKSPEEMQAIANLIDDSGTLNSAINAPIGVDVHKFSDLVDDFPSVSDYMRLNPEGPNPLEARNYVERLQENKQSAQEFVQSLGTEIALPQQEFDARIEEITKPSQEAKKVFQDLENFETPTFDENTDLFTKNEVEKFNKDLSDARIAVADSLKQDVESEFQTIENRRVREQTEAEIQQDIKDLEKEFRVLEQFDANKSTILATELRKNHKEPGHSPYAIDPATLPEDLKAIYLDNPKLKERKMFVEGGMTVEDAASVAGIDNPSQLLEILAETPSKKEIIESRKARHEQIRKQVRQDLEVEKASAIDEAFSKQTTAHLREAKFMVNKKWSTAKGIIRKVALKIPTSKELNTKAKDFIKTTRIKDLNHNQFMVGERRSQRNAIDQTLKFDIENAVKSKENAAFNTELAKETLIAKERVKRAEKFLKKIKTPRIEQELKDAGYTDAVNEILDVFNLDTSKRGLGKQGAYEAFVKKQVEAGNVGFEIPEKFNDVRENANELTVEQYLAITDRLENVTHQAKMKNKLYKKFQEKKMIQTEEAIVTKAEKLLEQHPDFDLKRADTVEENRDLTILGKVKGMMGDVWSLHTNAENIATRLDQDLAGGYFQELLIQPIKGDKDVYGERSGWKGKQDDISDFMNFVKKNSEKYGKKKFRNIQNDVRKVPEFEGFDGLGLGGGHIRKGELMMMMAYLGDPDGKARLENFVKKDGTRLDLDTIERVLERELDSDDAALVQNLMINSFKAYKDRSYKLHKDTTGQEPRMVEGVAFTHRGKVYEGGYFPNKYQFVSDDLKTSKVIERARKRTSAILGGDNSEMYSSLRAAEMTEQGRFEERTGSNRPLDLNFNNFISSMEEVIHDLNFRKVGIDNLKILKNPIMRQNIKSVVGDRNYKLLVNSTIEVVGEIENRNKNYFGEHQRIVDTVFGHLDKGFAISTLAMNVSSVAIQPVSLAFVPLRMGQKGASYLAKSAAKIAMNLGNLNEMRSLAEEINPAIKFERDAIDDSLVASAFKEMPSSSAFLKGYKKSAETINLLTRGRDFLANGLMSGLSWADSQLKVIATLGAYDQFVSGDSANYPMSRLQTMTDAEIHEAASAYARQIARLSLTTSAIDDKAPVQKFTQTRFLTKFYNDLRSQMNTVMAQGRKVKYSGKKAVNALESGDFRTASSEAFQATGEVMTLMIAASLARLYEDLVREEETPFDDITDIKSMDDLNEFGKATFSYMSYSPIRAAGAGIIGVRDVQNAIEFKGGRDYRNVQIPLMKQASDIATAGKGLYEWLDMADDTSGEMTEKQKKALAFSSSYLLGGLPVNGLYKLKKSYEEGILGEATDYTTKELKKLNGAIDNFREAFGDNPDAKDLIEDLNQLQKELLLPYAEDVKNVIPENTKEMIKSISSQGEWDKYDETTGAAGIYQFTEEKWDEIMNANPSLGLTENGRVSKDTSQQEKAMNWLIQDNTRGLIAFGIPVNEETLFGAHKFGIENYASIHEASNNDDLSKVLGNEINNPLFDNFKSVKKIKQFISNSVNNVKKEIDNDTP